MDDGRYFRQSSAAQSGSSAGSTVRLTKRRRGRLECRAACYKRKTRNHCRDRRVAGWSVATEIKITGGEDQSYFFNSWVAGSSPAGPKGNRSSMAEQRKHTLVAGSPVIVSLPWLGKSPAGNLKTWSGICCNGRSHNSSSYVGTGFIGGGDQGYIACP